MISEPIIRKPKLHFDTSVHTASVTFDDGKVRTNLPWSDYVEMLCSNAERDVIKIVIGQRIVTIRGHNLDPLVNAVEERSLKRLRAQPELMNDRKYEIDSFATEIRFQDRARSVDDQSVQKPSTTYSVGDLPLFR